MNGKVEVLASAFASKGRGFANNSIATGDKYIHFLTTLAQWLDKDTAILNTTYYSRSTTKRQNQIRTALERRGIRVIETTKPVPENTEDLTKYVEK